MNKRIDSNHLSAAMMTADAAVPVPRRNKPGSMLSQIMALEPGECTSKVRQVDHNLTFDEWAGACLAMREQLRNSLASSVAKAKEDQGGDYTIEVGDLMLKGKLYQVAIVSRHN